MPFFRGAKGGGFDHQTVDAGNRDPSFAIRARSAAVRPSPMLICRCKRTGGVIHFPANGGRRYNEVANIR